jgi:hypothetical protein
VMTTKFVWIGLMLHTHRRTDKSRGRTACSYKV